MAEQGRQLQEYVAQKKAGVSGPAPPVQRPEQGWREWLGGSVPGLSWQPLDADPLLPGLSASQRLLAAGLCVAGAALCFGLSALYLPLLLLRARKFAMLWSLGSLLGLAASALIRGPSRLLREPEPCSALYLLTLAGTLYAALGLRSTGLTLLGAAAQIVSGAAFLLGLLPGGTAGRRYIGSLCSSMLRRGVSKALPV
uniref:Vesicle transport protein n=1 Tax=Leptobrachium leishanense TaxID=445787 RepID=A0A8C5PIC6_9ANUR